MIKKIIKYIIFSIFSILIVLWSLFPFYVNIKRWYYGKLPIIVEYPIYNIKIFYIYYILYIILLIFLIYKVIKLYYMYNNEKNKYIEQIDELLQKPWDIIDKYIWERWYSFNHFILLFLDFLFKMQELGKYIYIGRSYIYLWIYYEIYKYIIYISVIICIIVLYIEVLYIQKIYYIFYVLAILLIYRIFGFLINRCISANKCLIGYLMDDFILKEEKEYMFETLPDNSLKDYNLTSYYKCDDENVVMIYKYKCEKEDNKYIYKWYNLTKNYLDINNDTQIRKELIKFCNSNEHEIKLNINKLSEEDIKKFESGMIRGISISLNNITVRLNGCKYYKEHVSKHILIMSIIRISSIIILLNIVLYINWGLMYL